jgi:HEAT repeat protein
MSFDDRSYEVSDSEIAEAIARLEPQLNDPDVARRRQAATKLYELCHHEGARAAAAIPLLLGCIADADAKIGESVVWGLRYCSPASVEPLVACLASGSPLSRQRACEALANIGDEAFIAAGPLRAILTDPVPEVAKSAAFALGLIHDTSIQTIAALFAMAEDSRARQRSAALHALGNIGKALPDPQPLHQRRKRTIEFLADPDEDVRWSACYVLESTGLEPGENVELLIKVLRDDKASRVRSIAVERLKELAPSAHLAPYLPTLVAVVREGGAEAKAMCECLAAMGPAADPAIPALVEASQAESDLAARAADALWKITRRAELVLPVIARVFDEIPEAACDLISEIGPAAGPLVDQVISALEDDDWDMQWAAADALGAIASDAPHVVETLIRVLAHPSPIVKGSVCRGLAKVGPTVLPILEKILGDSSDVRAEWAADAIGRMGYRGAEAAPVLRAAMEDSRFSVRAWAAISLGKVAGDTAAMPMLIELLEKNDRSDLRIEAAAALAAIGPPASTALPSLSAALSSGDEDLQFAAAEAIEAIGVKAN